MLPWTARWDEGGARRWLAVEQAPKTVNNHLIVLRRMLGVAVEWGLLERVRKRIVSS